jgi:hypothetical protein
MREHWPEWIAPVFVALAAGLAAFILAEVGYFPFSRFVATFFGTWAGLVVGLLIPDPPRVSAAPQPLAPPAGQVLSARKRLLCAAYFAAAWTGIVVVAVAAWYLPWHLHRFGGDPDVGIATWRAVLLIVRPLLAVLIVLGGPLALGCRGARAILYVWLTCAAGAISWLFYLRDARGHLWFW